MEVSAECHQRLAADGTAVPAQPFGEGHAEDCAWLPVGRSPRRRGIVDALNRQFEILHPWREDIAKDAPGFLDAELRCVRFVLHEQWFLARY
jgi:hypothetical protein